MVSGALRAQGLSLATVLSACVCACPAFAQSTEADASRTLERGESAEESFERNSLSLVIVSKDPTSTASDDTSPWRPVRGKYRWAMSYGDFYTTVGRQDLRAAQDRRDVTRGLLLWGGLAVTVGGLFLVVHGLGGGDFSTESAVGAGLVAGGGVSYLVGATMGETVISAREAQELAASHNDALRARLGVPEGSERSLPRGPSALRLRFALTPKLWAITLSSGL